MTPRLRRSIKIVSAQDIDETDRRFAVSYPGGVGERLLASIEKVGIIQPLVVIGRETPALVCGFKRLAVARLLSIENIPVRFFAGNDREALFTAVHDNLERGYNMVEKALCLSKMEEMGCTRQETLQVMPLLSLETHEKVLGTMIKLGGSAEAVKDLVVTRKLSLKNIGLLLSFEEPARSALAGLLAGFHTTESLVREILELFLLMRARKVPIDIERYREMDSATSLKTALKGLTSPIRERLEQSLAALQAECRLPPGLDIRVDPFFEKEYIDILVHFRNEAEGHSLVEKLLKLFREGQIGRILELTRS